MISSSLASFPARCHLQGTTLNNLSRIMFLGWKPTFQSLSAQLEDELFPLAWRSLTIQNVALDLAIKRSLTYAFQSEGGGGSFHFFDGWYHFEHLRMWDESFSVTLTVQPWDWCLQNQPVLTRPRLDAGRVQESSAQATCPLHQCRILGDASLPLPSYHFKSLVS